MFLDQIKEQVERQGGIHRRTVIGGECCDCECELTEGNWHSIIMVNEPGGCSIENLPVNDVKPQGSPDEASVDENPKMSNNGPEPPRRWIL